jgi:hypothetical protein
MQDVDNFMYPKNSIKLLGFKFLAADVTSSSLTELRQRFTETNHIHIRGQRVNQASRIQHVLLVECPELHYFLYPLHLFIALLTLLASCSTYSSPLRYK